MKILPNEVIDADLTALWYQQQLDIKNDNDVNNFVKGVFKSVSDICTKIKQSDVNFTVNKSAITQDTSKAKSKAGQSKTKGSVTKIDCPSCNKGQLRRIKNPNSNKYFY